MRIAWLAVLAACGDNLAYRFEGLHQVSGGSPYADGCNGGPQGGTVYPGMEVEPSIAADPEDDRHLVVAWQQDRWSSGGANGIGAAASFDGGASWRSSAPRFSRCAGGDYERASDPWLAIGSDRTTYAAAIAFDASTSRSGIVAASSPDGGATWNAPVVLIDDDDADVLNDKDSITADGDHVYVVWDRITGITRPTEPVGTGPAMLARGSAGGNWEPARPIYDPGVDAQTIGNIIAVLPDGTLVDVFDLITNTSSQNAVFSIAVIRSTDGGDTWSAPIAVAGLHLGGVAKGNLAVRDGAGLPAIAVDPASNSVYLAWEDPLDTGPTAILVARSPDGGLTWLEPVIANGAPDMPAFTPALAVADDGTVGVSYYDTREDDPQAASLHATEWLATSQNGGATWNDERMSTAVDLRPAVVERRYYFLGDYQGLVAHAGRFAAVFALAFLDTDPTDIFVRP